MPDGGTSATVAAAIGRARAMRMALLAEPLTAPGGVRRRAGHATSRPTRSSPALVDKIVRRLAAGRSAGPRRHQEGGQRRHPRPARGRPRARADRPDRPAAHRRRRRGHARLRASSAGRTSAASSTPQELFDSRAASGSNSPNSSLGGCDDRSRPTVSPAGDRPPAAAADALDPHRHRDERRRARPRARHHAGQRVVPPARCSADAGEIVEAGEERIRGGVAKRYRYPHEERARRARDPTAEDQAARRPRPGHASSSAGPGAQAARPSRL